VGAIFSGVAEWLRRLGPSWKVPKRPRPSSNRGQNGNEGGSLEKKTWSLTVSPIGSNANAFMGRMFPSLREGIRGK